MLTAIFKQNQLTVRSVLGTLAVTAFVVVAGCKSNGSTQTYSTPRADDEIFAKSAERPPNADTLFRMAKILAAQHKDDQCEAVCRNCIQRYPQYMPAYAELAQLQVRQRKVGAAIDTLKDGLTLQPKDAVLLNDLGMCHMLAGDFQAALAQFRAASEADPDNARYTANMAMANGMLGQYDEALALYQKVTKPGPAHYNVAVVAEARNDSAKADEEYAAALALDHNCQRKDRNGKK